MEPFEHDPHWIKQEEHARVLSQFQKFYMLMILIYMNVLRLVYSIRLCQDDQGELWEYDEETYERNWEEVPQLTPQYICKFKFLYYTICFLLLVCRTLDCPTHL